MCGEQRNFYGTAPHLDYLFVRKCVNGKESLVTSGKEVTKQQGLSWNSVICKADRSWH